jgi:hypothetical protein
MKKQLLNEINEMKRLFGYQRGVVISEQTIHTTPPGNRWEIMTPILKPIMIKQGYEVKQDSKGNWYYAKPINSVPDWDKVVKYFSGNTDSRWSWVSIEIIDGYEGIKLKSTDSNNRNATLSLFSDDYFASFQNWKGWGGSVPATWKWEGNRPVIKFEEKTKKALGYVKDTDTDWSAVTDNKINKVIGLNARGPLVKQIQNKLINMKFIGSTNSPITKDVEGCKIDITKCDGIYGKSTKEMVKQFQKDYGLDVDGVVGNQTYKAMFTGM